MSRSYRKTPITGITLADSDKDDKVRANRRVRVRNRQRLRVGLEPLDRRAITSPWDFAKDGKLWWSKDYPRREWARK